MFGAILVTSCLIQAWADDRELKMVAVVVKYEVVVDDVVRRSAAVFIVNDLIFFFFSLLAPTEDTWPSACWGMTETLVMPGPGPLHPPPPTNRPPHPHLRPPSLQTPASAVLV